MSTDDTNDLATLLDRQREASPELDAELTRSEPRRHLAMGLVGLRRHARLTQKELAVEMDCEQAFISRLESTAGPMPKQETIARYASACGFASSYVFIDRKDATHVLQAVSLTSDENDERLVAAALSDLAHDVVHP